MTVLLCEEQGFLLHRQTRIHLAENREVFATVAQDTRFNGVLTVRYIIPAIAKADLRFVRNIFVEVRSNHFHPFALYAPLIKFTGINQHLAVKHQHLVRRGDIERSGKIVRVVFQAHRISSLIRQMYFSASVRISATCFLRFGLVSRLGLKVKLYSSRWIMA